MLKRISVLLSSLIVAACGLTGGSAPVAPSKPAPVVGLALGGGASKGFAHIGVIKVLKEAGIPVKVVTGTSAGAVVGSMYASGMSPDRLELEAEIMNKADVIDFTLSFKGLIKGEKLAQYINAKTKQQLMQNYPINSGVIPVAVANLSKMTAEYFSEISIAKHRRFRLCAAMMVVPLPAKGS